MISLIKNSADCDLIHGNWTLAGIISWISSILHRLPYVVTVHGSDIYEGSKSSIIRYTTRLALSYAARIIAVSHSLARETSLIGVQKQIDVVPDGIEVDRFVLVMSQRNPFIL
jgi:glycosyltransferase involved in cell wall biosynthesis